MQIPLPACELFYIHFFLSIRAMVEFKPNTATASASTLSYSLLSSSLAEQLQPESFSTELLGEKPALLFTCPICLSIPAPDAALDHMQCGKIFCRHCITAWAGKSPLCPACNQKIGGEDLRAIKDKNKTVYQIMVCYRVHCPNFITEEKTRCDWVGEISQVVVHLRDCKYVENSCKWGCGAVMARIKISEHETKECLMRIVKCEFCEKYMTYMLLIKHKEKECSKNPDAVVACQYKEMGCGFAGKRPELEKHTKEAAKTHLACAEGYIAKLKSTIVENERIITELKAHHHAKDEEEDKQHASSMGEVEMKQVATIGEDAPKNNFYFKTCRNGHMMWLKEVPPPVACAACGNNTKANEKQVWCCTNCRFFICSSCVSIKYERDKEPFLYTYCPKCTNERAMVKRFKHFNKSTFDCGCVNSRKPGSFYYYCAYCRYTVCSKCQTTITY